MIVILPSTEQIASPSQYFHQFAARSDRESSLTFHHPLENLIYPFDTEDPPYTSKKKKLSGAVVRQRTMPTKRPPLVGDVSANFSG
jgi:hypothetical protein